MNQLTLVVVALVAFIWCGGNYCPSVLRQNKKLLLGVAVGMVLCSVMGLRLEGYGPSSGVVVSPAARARAAGIVPLAPTEGDAQLEHTRFGRQALTGDPNALEQLERPPALTGAMFSGGH